VWIDKGWKYIAFLLATANADVVAYLDALDDFCNWLIREAA
jgi:hypothetical protein